VVTLAEHPASLDLPQVDSPQAQVVDSEGNLAKDLVGLQAQEVSVEHQAPEVSVELAKDSAELPAQALSDLLAQEVSKDCRDFKDFKDYLVFPPPQVIKEVALLLPHLVCLLQAVLSVELSQVTKLKDLLADGHNKAIALTIRYLLTY